MRYSPIMDVISCLFQVAHDAKLLTVYSSSSTESRKRNDGACLLVKNERLFLIKLVASKEKRLLEKTNKDGSEGSKRRKLTEDG